MVFLLDEVVEEVGEGLEFFVGFGEDEDGGVGGVGGGGVGVAVGGGGVSLLITGKRGEGYPKGVTATLTCSLASVSLR